MKSVAKVFIGVALLSGISLGQATFEVTGTPVPPDLLRQNYGSLPKGIGAFDLNVCGDCFHSKSAILNLIKPSTSTSALEKFESQVLEPALTLDAGSCIERTVFTVATQEQMRATRFSFHVQ